MEKINFIYSRFSLVSKKQEFYNVLGKTFEDYKKLILDENRLNKRLDLFINYQLPLIDIASQYNNIHYYVMSSMYLSDRIREVLETAEREYDFLQIEYFDENTVPDIKMNFLEYASKYCDVLISSTRLDDDDMLSPQFFEMLNRYVDIPFVNMCISLNTGYCGLYKESGFEKFSKFRFMNSAQGLSYISRIINGEFTTPYYCPPGAHNDVDKRVPSIQDATRTCYIYTQHGSNFEANVKRSFDFERVEKTYFPKEESYNKVDAEFNHIFSINKVIESSDWLERIKKIKKEIYTYNCPVVKKLDKSYSTLSRNEIVDKHLSLWRKLFELQYLLDVYKPVDILELGLGESSKLIAKYANFTSASHIIIDVDPNYSKAFLQSSPAVFAKTRVHISPLLKVKKDEREYCCFQNFKKVVGSSKFNMIIQHCPRGGDNSLIYADLAMQLHDILDNQFVILLESADTPEMHIYVDDIVALLQKREVSAVKKYIALPQGEFCLITSAKEGVNKSL